MEKYTPMIQQYLKIKADYQDAFLFYRLGDFYEMFFDDALRASKELEITLTSRQGGTKEPIPMCGVPYHSVQGYIEVLIEKGYKVAICEQTSDPKETKGIVTREVTQVITPGTITYGKNLQTKSNNYLGCAEIFAPNHFGLATADLATGSRQVSDFYGKFDLLADELANLSVKEVIVKSDFPENYRKKMIERGVVSISEENEVFDFHFSDELSSPELNNVCGRLHSYILRTQKRALLHLQPFRYVRVSDYLRMDYYAKRNLELTETIRTNKGNKGSLLWLLDETKTAMGGRLLRQWLDFPLLNSDEILYRQKIVTTFINNFFARESLSELLANVYDLERLVGKISYGTCNGRDLVYLRKSLEQIPEIKRQLQLMQSAETNILAENLKLFTKLCDLLTKAISDAPPISIKDGNLIKEGYNFELDRLRDASKNGKNWIANLEQKEKEKTGIKSLKVGYNRIFGYFFEITKSNLAQLNDNRYERKQTLANAERFVTNELKEMETVILEAEEKSIALEYDLFIEVRENVKKFMHDLQALARKISEIDVFYAFAKVSEEEHFICPKISFEKNLVIHGGRHAVVQKILGAQEYVENDCFMKSGEREILLLTGPNMSGKSTYMRQIALIIIMHQIGCFVPATAAELPIFDQIFTRIGASDDLSSGQSTFMVEMAEARNALMHATSNSLLIFDEIGRGTSTYDGLALAQAIIEYIHEDIKALTLFSTHYHELTALETKLFNLKNIHVKAVEKNGQVVFLHKVSKGATNRSYGIHVAALANMPEKLLKRAYAILRKLETVKSDNKDVQLTLFDEAFAEVSFKEEHPIISELKKTDVLSLTPLEAINLLFKWKEQV